MVERGTKEEEEEEMEDQATTVAETNLATMGEEEEVAEVGKETSSVDLKAVEAAEAASSVD